MSLQSILHPHHALEFTGRQWRRSVFSLYEEADELAAWHALLSHRGLMTMPATARVLAASISWDKELGELPELTSVALKGRRHAGLRLAVPCPALLCTGCNAMVSRHSQAGSVASTCVQLFSVMLLCTAAGQASSKPILMGGIAALQWRMEAHHQRLSPCPWLHPSTP